MYVCTYVERDHTHTIICRERERARERCSAAHKIHAELHALKLECHSWADVPLLARCVARLTDQGVEASMADFPPFHLSDMFPWTFVGGDDRRWGDDSADND